MGRKSRAKRERNAQRPRPKGLTIRHGRHDVTNSLILRDIKEAAINPLRKDTFLQQIQVEDPPPEAAINPMVNEQAAIEAGNATVQRLMATTDLPQIVNTLIQLRRAYLMATNALDAVLDEAKRKVETGEAAYGELARDICIHASAAEATKPFSEHQVMQSLIGQVLPWLGEVVDTHSKADETSRQSELALAEAARRARPVPFKLGTDAEALDKTVPIIFFGAPAEVHWMLDHFCQMALEDAASEEEGGAYTVLRFQTQAPQEAQHRQLIRVSPDMWKECAGSERALQACLLKVSDSLSQQPDFLVCDDLSAAGKPTYIGQPPAAIAGHAQRVLRKWGNTYGCGILAGLYWREEGNPDCGGLEFDQLRTHTRFFRVIRWYNEEQTAFRLGLYPPTLSVPVWVSKQLTTDDLPTVLLQVVLPGVAV
jgi:hypothetical protein